MFNYNCLIMEDNMELGDELRAASEKAAEKAAKTIEEMTAERIVHGLKDFLKREASDGKKSVSGTLMVNKYNADLHLKEESSFFVDVGELICPYQLQDCLYDYEQVCKHVEELFYKMGIRCSCYLSTMSINVSVANGYGKGWHWEYEKRPCIKLSISW